MHPIFIKIGTFEIRWYGVMIALAFIAGTWLGAREARRKGINPDVVYDLLFYVMLASIAGARLYYVVASNLPYFLEHPLDIVAIWKGGMALHGGLIGGIAAGAWFCHQRGIRFWSFADLLTPSIMLGQAVGRGACTLNGCSYGRPTDLPWAVVFTDPNSAAPHNVALHPTQFYEMATDFTLLALLWRYRDSTRFDGQLLLTYAMLYAIARFVLEFFRGDSLRVGGIPVPQLFSVFLLLFAAGLYLWRRILGPVLPRRTA